MNDFAEAEPAEWFTLPEPPHEPLDPFWGAIPFRNEHATGGTIPPPESGLKG